MQDFLENVQQYRANIARKLQLFTRVICSVTKIVMKCDKS